MNRRIPVLVIVIGLLLSGFLIDRTFGADDDDASLTATDGEIDFGSFAIAAADDARSSTWFCAGGTADEEAFATHVITIVNPTPDARSVTLTVFSGVVAPPPPGSEAADSTTTTTETTTTTAAPEEAAGPLVTEVDLAGRSRYRVVLSDLVDSPIASALVESSAGGIVVEHEVVSVNGRDAKPCVTEAATEWYFAWGNTTVSARELLVLFNPFPADAIVDGDFSTEDGAREPARFDGLVIPAQSTVAIDLGDDVTRREEVAASIRARTGRIVVDRILRVGNDTNRGLTVQSGVSEPQVAWAYPDGLISDTVDERFVVYNPGAELAEVTITISLDDPETNGVPETIDVTLPPGTHESIDITEDLGIPLGVAHSSIVRSANGVPIVSEQVQFAEGATRRGIGVTTGTPVESETWTFAAGAANGDNDPFLVLANFDPEVLAEVDVSVVSEGQVIPVSDLQGIEIGPQQRISIRLAEKIQRDDLAIVVTSSEPIIAQRSWFRVNDRGLANSVGVPSGRGLRLLVDPLEVDLSADLGELEDAPTTDPDSPPTAPDDVELPTDETIVVDPDAEAEIPGEATTTTGAPATTTTAAPATTATTAAG